MTTKSMTNDTATGAESILWDLSDLYSSTTDGAFVSDLEGINKRCMKFNERWKGALATSSISEFVESVIQYEQIVETMDRMGSFSQLIWSTNTEDQQNGKLLQTVREKLTEASQHLVFYSLEIMDLSDAQTSALLDAPEMATRRHWLELVLESKQYRLSEDVEKVLTEKQLSSRASWVRLHDELSNAQVFRLNGHEYTESQVLKLLHEPNREARKAAAESLSEGLAQGVRTQAFIFNTVVADHASNTKLRGYKTWLSSRNETNEASDESVAALISSVENRYDLIRRFYTLKKSLLGYSDFYDYDRYAPIGDDRTFWTWEQARDIVLKAYHAFHPSMGDIAAMFFEKNWIHAPVLKGKNGGAYSAGTIASAHPYVFMNYTGTSRDVQTLAHELGHGIHQYLSRKQGPLLMDTPLTVAETASVFGEIITFNSLFETATTNQQRLEMLMAKLDDIMSTVFRQIALNRFEDALHTTRKKEGELTVPRINDLWMTTQSAQFMDAVTLTPGYETWWSYISHFMHAPGYVYAYAYGELLVLALHEIYKEEKDTFPSKYIELLSSGGSKKPTDLLAPFNINVEDPKFWSIGLDVIDRVLTEAEALARN